MQNEYKVISDYSLEQLILSVTHYLEEGWQLVGGISATKFNENPDDIKEDGVDTLLYLQAMAK